MHWRAGSRHVSYLRAAARALHTGEARQRQPHREPHRQRAVMHTHVRSWDMPRNMHLLVLHPPTTHLPAQPPSQAHTCVKRRATSNRASSAAALADSRSAKDLSGSLALPAQVDTWLALLRGSPAGAGTACSRCSADACMGGCASVQVSWAAVRQQGGPPCRQRRRAGTSTSMPAAPHPKPARLPSQAPCRTRPPVPQVLQPCGIVLAAALVQPPLGLLHLPSDLRAAGQRASGFALFCVIVQYAADRSISSCRSAPCRCPDLRPA